MAERLARYREMRDFGITPDPRGRKVVPEKKRLRYYIERLKTTGVKGLHVVAPIEAALEWDEVKAFTQRIAETLVKARPDLFTARIAKARRPNKVFADYLRNSETASAVAAFSPRARPNAGVSVPLEWDELDPKDDLRSRFNVLNVPQRLAGLRQDPWADYWKRRQAITPQMKKSLGF